MSAPLYIAFYASSARKYDFDIKVSNDGQKWKKVNTYASDGKTQELKFERFEFEKVNARYIQYCGRGATVNGGGTNPYNSFYEFKASDMIKRIRRTQCSFVC